MRRRRPKKNSLEAIMLEEQRRRDRWGKMITKLARKGAAGNKSAEKLANGLLTVVKGP